MDIPTLASPAFMTSHHLMECLLLTDDISCEPVSYRLQRLTRIWHFAYYWLGTDRDSRYSVWAATIELEPLVPSICLWMMWLGWYIWLSSAGNTVDWGYLLGSIKRYIHTDLDSWDATPTKPKMIGYMLSFVAPVESQISDDHFRYL